MLTSKKFGPTCRNNPSHLSEKPQKQKKCCICKTMFKPMNSMQKVCGTLCALDLVSKNKVRDAAKREQEERAKTRVQREAMKSRQQWMREAQSAFNAFIRERDADQPCICCGRATTKVSGLNSHGWDAGHYRSVGSAPHMRFEENNVHRQLVYCNRNRSGNATDYRIGLIAKIGLEAVEILEADNTVRKFSIDELKAIKATYKAKLKQLLADKEVA